MIKRVIAEDHGTTTWELNGNKTIQRVNHIFQLIAAAYENDPGTSDLDDEQPVYPIRLTLGDVRLARRLTR
jgi:hypothetical protein